MSGLILLLSGPNLNLLGTREPEIYGSDTLEDHVATATQAARSEGYALQHFQSNAEGELVEAIHKARDTTVGIVFNPGAFTHYGWAIHDALASYPAPVVELHLSQPARREAWRHTSVVAPVATATVSGFGAAGYALALRGLLNLIAGA